MDKRLASCTKKKNEQLYRRWSDRRPPENECHLMHQVPLYGKTMSRGKKNETPVQHLEAFAPLSQYKQGQVTHRQQCSQCSTSAEERLQPSVRPSVRSTASRFVYNERWIFVQRARLQSRLLGCWFASKKQEDTTARCVRHSPLSH